MIKLAIVGLNKKRKTGAFLKELNLLKHRYHFDYDPYIYSQKNFDLYDTLATEGIAPENYDAVVSLGGDGTFLYTSRVFAGTGVPIFSVNLGKLGFNTTIEIKEFEYYLRLFLENAADYSYKTLLDVHVENEDTVYSVLNEGVISHTGISRMIRLKVDLDGQSLCDFRGDGLIISSPTGSTAYNLSAGGPILHPSLDAFVVTPICPHSFAIRPYIIPFDEVIHIKIEESSAQPQITLDGQKIIILNKDQNITMKRSAKQVKVIKGPKNFSEILKQKLGWNV